MDAQQRSAQSLTKDEVLDSFTLYWLTNTGTSAGRLYWESHGRAPIGAAVQKTAEIALPVAITDVLEEVYRAPESRVRGAYPNLVYFHEVDKGGYFAAWEQPQLFASELRAAFRSRGTASGTWAPSHASCGTIGVVITPIQSGAATDGSEKDAHPYHVYPPPRAWRRGRNSGCRRSGAHEYLARRRSDVRRCDRHNTIRPVRFPPLARSPSARRCGCVAG